MVAVFFAIAKNHHHAAIWWISLGSFFFYGFWNPAYLPLLLCSIVVNYGVGKSLALGRGAKFKLIAGLFFNIGLLGYFKYTNFVVDNINLIFGTQFQVKPVVLPLAISFFTFQQIVWIVDKYRGEALKGNIRDYVAAVTFFPHLIAGPIVQYKHLLPQFQSRSKALVNWENLAQGLFLISVGLFKKLVIADTLSVYVGNGFDGGEDLSLIFAWMAALSYTFQIYFDFSGYCDIAIGSAWLLNIRLPDNFHSPYKAANVREFWQRWHITLGYFLTNYLYLPLGGNRKGKARTCINILLVMILSGLWHGAAYGFILWGLAHGLAMVVQRLFPAAAKWVPQTLAIVMTFTFVSLAWVLFRAKDLSVAANMYKGMFGLNGLELSGKIARYIPDSINFRIINTSTHTLFQNGSIKECFTVLLLSFLIVFMGKEAMQLWKRAAVSQNNIYIIGISLMAGVLLFFSLLKSMIIPHTEFIYFNF